VFKFLRSGAVRFRYLLPRLSKWDSGGPVVLQLSIDCLSLSPPVYYIIRQHQNHQHIQYNIGVLVKFGGINLHRPPQIGKPLFQSAGREGSSLLHPYNLQATWEIQSLSSPMQVKASGSQPHQLWLHRHIQSGMHAWTWTMPNLPGRQAPCAAWIFGHTTWATVQQSATQWLKPEDSEDNEACLWIELQEAISHCTGICISSGSTIAWFVRSPDSCRTKIRRSDPTMLRHTIKQSAV
jgi:hypothetical protein